MQNGWRAFQGRDRRTCGTIFHLRIVTSHNLSRRSKERERARRYQGVACSHHPNIMTRVFLLSSSVARRIILESYSQDGDQCVNILLVFYVLCAMLSALLPAIQKERTLGNITHKRVFFCQTQVRFHGKMRIMLLDLLPLWDFANNINIHVITAILFLSKNAF